MRKILLAIVLLAVGVSVPVGVLVVRALESAALEEESRHRSVADRAFDEMESSLSEFLAEEELRPFGEYRFYEELSPARPESRRLSPLAEMPSRSFVLGYFQIEPDGNLGTPRRPRDVALAVALGDFRPSAELDALEARLRSAWATALSSAPTTDSYLAQRTRDALDPTTTARPSLPYTASRDAERTAPGLLERVLGGTSASLDEERPSPLPASTSADTDTDAAEEPGRLATRSGTRAEEGRADARARQPFADDQLALRPPPSASRPSSPPAVEDTVEDDAGADSYDTYDILRSFNSAGEKRAQRKQKVRVERASAIASGRSAAGTLLAEAEEPAADALAKATAERAKDDALELEAGSKEERGVQQELFRDEPKAVASLPSRANSTGAADAGSDPMTGAGPPRRSLAQAPRELRPGRVAPTVRSREGAPRAPAVTPAAAPTAPGTVRVALDPMVGRSPDTDTLLLYRTVVAGQQGYRQGLLVDWRGLGEWLEAQVIAPSGIARSSRVVFFSRGQGSSPPENRGDEEYVYRHEFAEPFDAFGVELALAPLPGGRGTGTIHALAALLAVVGAGGLFALYRMVAVVVEFAERRNRFVAAVSHELKTPLTSIRMYGEMLRDGMVSDDAKRAEYYGTITDESERLSRLIDNVLDFSRLEKGERNVRTSNAPLWPVVLEAVEKLRPHAESQGFALVAASEEPALEASFDRDVVTQVVFNLVDNALKYAAAAERREIVIACRSLAGAAELSIRDFGPGVPANELTRIFEPFFRREDELTRTTKGTGIGLALVKDLVEAMDGEIEATTPEGGGLQLAVRLPRASAPVT